MPLRQTNRITPITPAVAHTGPRVERAARGGSWAPILLTAAHQVAQRSSRNPETVELLSALVTRMVETRITTGTVIDESLRSELGRRLLDELRREVVRGWAVAGAPDAELPRLMVAIEDMRDAIQPTAQQSFDAQLRGADGMELLVNVVHDLRSPLTSILFLAETLQHGRSGVVNDVQRRQLGIVYAAALKLSSVASDIIDLTRSELLMEPEPVPFSVEGVLEAVNDIVRPIAEEKQLAVRLGRAGADERLGHPVALSRVLLNLTTNALKFTDQGYVEIATREVSPTRVEFSVRDSGKGIDPAMLPTLFDPVRRVTRREHSAKLFSQTGLGLTICRRLVEAMGSTVQVESRAGWGTRFLFELELPICPTRRSGPRPVRRSSDPHLLTFKT
jgi:signal transduction histidine kinase